MKKNLGFTLIELVITFTILALLASVALPLSEMSVKRGKEQDLRRALREVRGAIDAYKRAADEGKIAKPADKTGYPPTLAALVEGAEDVKNPKGAKIVFLRRIPPDPVTGQEWGLRSYASPHNEPQAGADVYDVFSRSGDTGMNGIAYKEW
jgi:general secretion pathway protein G